MFVVPRESLSWKASPAGHRARGLRRPALLLDHRTHWQVTDAQQWDRHHAGSARCARRPQLPGQGYRSERPQEWNPTASLVLCDLNSCGLNSGNVVYLKLEASFRSTVYATAIYIGSGLLSGNVQESSGRLRFAGKASHGGSEVLWVLRSDGDSSAELEATNFFI